MEKSVKHSKVEMMHVIFYPLYVFMLCLKIWILCFSKIWYAQKLKSLEPGLCLILHYKFLIFFFFHLVDSAHVCFVFTYFLCVLHHLQSKTKSDHFIVLYTVQTILLHYSGYR